MDYKVEILSERVSEALSNGIKLVLIQHTMNVDADPYRRHVSLWIISDKIGVYNLADLVQELCVARRLRFKDQLSITSPDDFIRSFLRAFIEKFHFDLPTFNGYNVDGFYRWIAA